MMNVHAAMMIMPAYPGTFELTAFSSCAPTITLTADQPTQARMLKNATIQSFSSQPYDQRAKPHVQIGLLTDLDSIEAKEES